MADNSDPHADAAPREAPSQGVFIGWLALALLAFAVIWAATGLLAGATHGWQ
ncbi:MAG TPA: hypothetical protein VHZ56_04435 [Devosia sp.]|jgi:hypothetical protein|nr:hypothetical protein [Devosia sp.]